MQYAGNIVSCLNNLNALTNKYNEKATKITSEKLVVPVALWKVIIGLPVGSDDLARINAQTRVITVWMPNTNVTGEGAWGSYRVSVDEVEKQTGYDLLSNVSTSVQLMIEAKADNVIL